MTSRRLLLTALAACANGWPQSRVAAQAGAPLRVAAASDMLFVLKELAARFELETGHRVLLQSGASGNLARQIAQGMAVDLFFSADESYVFQLADAGLTLDRGARYASGRLALLVPKNSALALDARMAGIGASINRIQRFAIANPEHAPYGRAAREALRHAGLWDLLAPRIVLGENVAHATQFVASAAAQAGIVSLSMARAPEVAKATRHALLDENQHTPLHQRLVALKAAPAAAAAQAFIEFIARADSRALLRQHGLGDPT